MYCWEKNCGCEVIEKPGEGKGMSVLYECSRQTYGIGMYVFWGVYVFLVGFLYQFLQKGSIGPQSAKVIFGALIFWIAAWIILTHFFSIPVLFDEPWEGDWFIFPSALTLFFGFYPWLLQMFIFTLTGGIAFFLGFVGLSFGWLLRFAFEKIYQRFI